MIQKISASCGAFLIATGAAAFTIVTVTAFVAVGGPGHARDDRIDHWRLAAVAGAAYLADCAFQLSKEAPISLTDARELLDRNWTRIRRTSCGVATDPNQDGTKRNDALQYSRLGLAEIRICNDFLRPKLEPPMINDPSYADVIYSNGPFGISVLNVPRVAAGRFCYHIRLPLE